MNGSFMTRLFAVNVVTLPATNKFPVMLTSPEIVPPLAENLVLAKAKAALAWACARFALTKAALAVA